MGERLLSPKEIASLLGISMATVNYYTNLGLFRSEERKGNMRLYSKSGILKSFARIRKLRQKGYSLKLISHHP
jgi:DNA-binding transcriptional MerR regulator